MDTPQDSSVRQRSLQQCNKQCWDSWVATGKGAESGLLPPTTFSEPRCIKGKVRTASYPNISKECVYTLVTLDQAMFLKIWS